MPKTHRSLVWQYFLKEYRGDKAYGVCNICKKDLKMNSGSTLTLSGHLLSNHKDEYIEMCQNQKMQNEAEAVKEDKVEEAEDELETVGAGNLVI